jgi:hypothetical protein
VCGDLLYKDHTVLTLFNLFRLAIHIHRPFKSIKLVYYCKYRLKNNNSIVLYYFKSIDQSIEINQSLLFKVVLQYSSTSSTSTGTGLLLYVFIHDVCVCVFLFLFWRRVVLYMYVQYQLYYMD